MLSSIPHRAATTRSVMIALVLGLVGLALNLPNVSVLGGETPQFLFGGIPVLVALAVAGPVLGSVAALISLAPLLFPQDLSGLVVIVYLAESLFVYYVGRRLHGFALPAVAFWLTLGPCLDWPVYAWALGVPHDYLVLVFFKQVLNGALNAAVADGLLVAFGPRLFALAGHETDAPLPLRGLAFRVALGVVILPVIAGTLWATREAYANSVSTVYGSAYAAAQHATTALRLGLEAREQLVSRLGREIDLADAAGRATTAETLRRFLAEHPEFLNLAATDPEGIVTHAAPEVTSDGTRLVGRTLGHRPYFAEARGTKSVTWAPLVLGQLHVRNREGAEPVVIAATPLYDSHAAFRGITMGAMNALEVFPRLLPRRERSPVSITVFDEEMQVVYSDDPSRHVGDRLRDEAIHASMAGTSQRFSYFPPKSDTPESTFLLNRLFAVSQPVRAAGLHVIADVPSTVVRANMRTATMWALGWFLLSLVAVSSIARWMAKAGTRQILTWQQAVDEVAGGRPILPDIVNRAFSSRINEVRSLASSLRKMDEAVRAERDRVLATAADHREQLLALARHANALIFLKDLEGRYLFVNRHFCEVRQVTPEGVIGKTAEDLLGREHTTASRAHEQAVRATGHAIEVVEEVPTPDAGVRSYAVTRFPLRDADGAIYAVGGIATDITERQRAEEALLDSEERFRQLAEVFPETVFEADLDGRITYANEHGFRAFGYTPAELEDPGVAILQLAAEEDRPAIVARMRERVEGLQGGFIEYRALRKDGTSFAALAYSAPMLRQGQAVGLRGFILDITQRKRAEQTLIETNRQLAEATANARALAEQAERANQAKSEFLANMSHEIRTPMNGVIGMTGLLLDSPLSEQQRHYAETVRRSAESLLRLLNDILDYSKVEAGHLEFEAIPFTLSTVLEDVSSALRPRAIDKGLTLCCSTDEDVPRYLSGDPGRLRQVLANLAGNAVKFTHQGHVTIRVSRQDRAANCAPDKILLRFTVTDTGVGIPREKFARLFEKFSQVDASITRRYGGTGLGLAISKRLAEQMGGEIGVTSEEGRGSQFWFTARFGFAAAPIELSPAAEAPEVLRGTGRILLAEDNGTNQEVALGILAKLGLQVDAVTNGAEALDALAARPYDLVLMDVQMPELDGLEATRRIRRLQPGMLNHGIPVLAMTAHAMQGDREQCLEAGMNDYITKPVSAAALIAELNRWLPSASGAPPAAAGPATGTTPPRSASVESRAETGVVFDREDLLQRLMGDEELATMVIEGFLGDAPSQLARLQAHLDAGEIVAVRHQVHTLKGASANVGGERVRQAAIRMELAAKSDDLAGACAEWPALSERFEELRQALETELRGRR